MPSFAGNAVAACVIPAVIFIHLAVAPYTKIEESFNIEAVHDLLTFGFPRSQQDLARFEHVLFPGPVPRTFVGPLALAAAASPIDPRLSGLQRQLLVRGLLGLYNAIGILYFRRMVRRVFDETAANWFALFSAAQFHVMFWASRTLPNFFVYGWCAIALADLLPLQCGIQNPRLTHVGRTRRGLIVLTVLGIVFRSEVGVLLAAHVLVLLRPLIRQLSFWGLVTTGLVGIVIGLALTVPVDSFLWNKLEWPELTSFIFNVVEGKSSDWGTSPVHYYFTSALPRLLLNPVLYLVCIPTAVYQPAVRGRVLPLLVPSLVYVAAYSLLPHKERRFVIYILPPLTAAAAAGATFIWARRMRTFVYRAASALLVASVPIALLANVVMLGISAINYPGAAAVQALHQVASTTGAEVHVHLDTLTIMTGATRFMELGNQLHGPIEANVPRWVYDKTEQSDRTGNATFWNSFDYALAELPERLTGNWEAVAVVEGFDGIEMLGPDRPAPPLGSGQVAAAWETAVQLIRRHVTRGRWAQVRMRPLIHVLQNKKPGIRGNR